jgi:hypothetical protein
VTWQAWATRLTICPLRDHMWVRTPYPDGDGSLSLRCARCGKERDDGGKIFMDGTPWV